MLSQSFGFLSPCLKHRCFKLRFQTFSAFFSISSSKPESHSSKKEPLMAEEAAARAEAYRQLENLDFKSAAKILFTTPPKRKKFGLDFHLVQLFFACLPSFAVYLVAQYARSEIRRMEAEAEQKKKLADEEDKTKITELTPTKDLSNNELSEVKIRLDALEEAVKEIVDERKKITDSKPNSNRKAGNEKVESADKNSENRNKAKDYGGSSATITPSSEMRPKDADTAGG
ncbi:uncharacterized protein LOC110039583 [Phalaenopsis equestris]|uniref:uncharacterized protein LOC110039583 n=1 Tax=Phalaenopsis equestris TaxID=78828 RepID=UPI0009E3DA4C|nr:uncharacterized protein LOC110039583 [Phalaenopsis equestris]XP_020600364.1 uncharacterized protein LOC110039583 [Phalaenopsis equestris]